MNNYWNLEEKNSFWQSTLWRIRDLSQHVVATLPLRNIGLISSAKEGWLKKQLLNFIKWN